MESDDENLVIALDQVNINDEGASPEPGGEPLASAAGSLPPTNPLHIESEWDTFQSSIAR